MWTFNRDFTNFFEVCKWFKFSSDLFCVTREKSRVQVESEIGFGFHFHWLINWCEIFKPITRRLNCDRAVTFFYHQLMMLFWVQMSYVSANSPQVRNITLPHKHMHTLFQVWLTWDQAQMNVAHVLLCRRSLQPLAYKKWSLLAG